jgi:predicted alpha/beta-fold hydrolase
LWGKLIRRQEPVPTRIERWDTPDGDFLDLHRLDGRPGTPRVLLLHGLEGTVRSHYAQGLLNEMRRRGWFADLLIWRSCGSDPNRARRFYHSGETSDLAFVLDRIIAEHPTQSLAIAGVSLGGNVLLKYLGEHGTNIPPSLAAAAAISVPFDLGRGARHIDHGFSKVYQRYFLDSLIRKTREKLTRYPDLIPYPERVTELRSLIDFDNLLTSHIHGFADADAYYEASSSIKYLSTISTNTLLLNAFDDPFLPSQVLDEVQQLVQHNHHITAEFPTHGGHAGFIGGWNPLRPDYYLERRVGEFLTSQFGNHSTPS